MKLRIKQPISPTRVLIGAGITVLGIYILRESSELIGLILLLVGLIVGIRGSASPIISAIVFAIYFSLVVLFLFWTTPHTDGWTFEEWLQEHWLKVVIYGVFFVGMIISHFRTQQSSWSALYADYSEVPNWNPKSQKYPMQGGLLRVDEEFFEVSSIATEIGLILSRNDGESLFFSWDKIKEIRVLDQSPNRANVEVIRRIPVPLRLDVPWADDFGRWVPSSVQTFGA